MSIVNVTNVVVLDNPTAFGNPLTFEVTFECLEALDAGKRKGEARLVLGRFWVRRFGLRNQDIFFKIGGSSAVPLYLDEGSRRVDTFDHPV